MTAKQTSLYWREWAAAKKTGNLTDQDRHRLHTEALGAPKSSRAFTNADLDKVLATFRAISRPADLNAQLDAQQQPRERLLYAIAAAADLPYIERLCEDRFHTTDYETLDTDQLRQLLMTLKSRARTRAKQSPIADRPSPISEPALTESTNPF